MIYRILFFLIFYPLTDICLLAQSNSPICETIEKTDEEMERLPWYGNNTYLETLRDSAETLLNPIKELKERNGENMCSEIDAVLMIPIRFWIYRNNEMEGGMPNDRELQEMMDALNELYRNNGIITLRFFMVCPQIINDADIAAVTD